MWCRGLLTDGRCEEEGGKRRRKQYKLGQKIQCKTFSEIRVEIYVKTTYGSMYTWCSIRAHLSSEDSVWAVVDAGKHSPESVLQTRQQQR